MAKQFFITLTREAKNVRQNVDKAYPFTYEGIEMFVFKNFNAENYNKWTANEVSTGLQIPYTTDKTKKGSIERAIEFINKVTPAGCKHCIDTQAARISKEGYTEDVN